MANVSQEHSKSLWMELGPAIEAPVLGQDLSCDVVVVGAGIAGLSCAYELARLGYAVVVIDRGPIGGGMTARTTAHLASALDDYYSELIRAHGEAAARRYHESQVAAINRIEAICAEEAIDADFARLDGFLIPARPEDWDDLDEEYAACQAIGVDVSWVEHAPLPALDPGRSLRFAGQARMHPAKYLAGLARCITARGGQLFAGTAYTGHEQDGDRVVLTTANGPTISAAHAVFATNSPVNDKVTLHTKSVPYRTYVVAGRVPRGSVPDALVWDTLEAYHYVRLQPADEASDFLIVGGEDHRSGEANDMEARLAALEEWARRHYPMLGAIEYRWSGQVMEPIDFQPFTGRNPGDRNIYVHTADSGQGMTNGVLASLVIPELICGQDARFAEVVEAGRKPLGLPAVEEFMVGQAGAMRNMAEHLGPSEVNSVDEIPPGSGAVMRQGTLKKLAVYKDAAGELTVCSAICTHVGCVVHWNPFEQCWDCPCHGSQFAPDGRVLNGPALRPLDPEPDAAARAAGES